MRQVLTFMLFVVIAGQAVNATYPVCSGDFACDPAQSVQSGGQNVCCPGLNNGFANVGSSCKGPTDCTLAATYRTCPHSDPACGGGPEPSYNGISYCCPTTTTQPAAKNALDPSRLQCTQPTQGICGTTIDTCNYYTDCRSCNAYSGKCGWCGAFGACIAGGSAGSTDGSCNGNGWTYTYAKCPAPIAGGWSDWSTCSASTCGTSSGTQTRTCTSPSPSDGGAACTGASSQACSAQIQSCGGGASIASSTAAGGSTAPPVAGSFSSGTSSRPTSSTPNPATSSSSTATSDTVAHSTSAAIETIAPVTFIAALNLLAAAVLLLA